MWHEAVLIEPDKDRADPVAAVSSPLDSHQIGDSGPATGSVAMMRVFGLYYGRFALSAIDIVQRRWQSATVPPLSVRWRQYASHNRFYQPHPLK
jgi:hypothetical protein